MELTNLHYPTLNIIFRFQLDNIYHLVDFERFEHIYIAIKRQTRYHILGMDFYRHAFARRIAHTSGSHAIENVTISSCAYFS